MMLVLLFTGFLIMLAIAAAFYVWNNKTYAHRQAREVWKAGFVKKEFHLPNGYQIVYVEGPENGPPLILLHAQAASKRSYYPVLPALSKHFRVFAVDLIGHGESDRAPDAYTISHIGNDIATFINDQCTHPVYLSGHSSGGLIAAWLAANKPDLVKATLYEDPPFLSTVKERMPKQFNYIDLARPAKQFLAQAAETDFALYYIVHNAWISYFGGARPNIIRHAKSFRKAYPQRSINIWYLPPTVNESFADMHQFDPHFAARFYDYTWFEETDQKQLLSHIQQPSILVHAKWRVTKNGILEGAMTDQDAEVSCSLMEDCQLERVSTGHNFHVEDPKKFVRLLLDLKS